jgi:hypothetical protein
MQTAPHTAFRSSWGQALSVLLVGLLALQGLPLQGVVQAVQSPSPHHECTHPTGYCPMNPDGPCTCNHADTDAPDEPTVRACSGASTSGLAVAVVGTWVIDRVGQMLAPRERPMSRTPIVSFLSSQRVGDRIFHPPRLPAEDRSGRPLPALGHS